jgi:charged multivesicular body protein 2A
MGNKPAPPVQKTPKELQREMNRSIDRILRDFNRDKSRIQLDVMKMKRELERMVKNGEPKASQRIIAQNLLKNEAYMNKYDLLEAKMKGVKIQLASVSTTEAMVSIMKGMGQILGKATDSINVNNVQNVIEDFNMKLEEQANVNEMLDEAFETEDEVADDQQIDQYIDQVANKVGGKGNGGTKLKNTEENTEDITQMIADLKK